MRSTLRWLLLPALSLWIGPSSNSAISATLPPEYDWLLKNVCADASNRPVAADPYYGCPAGTTERDIQIGEPPPYVNHDQPQAGHPDGYQRRDSYPVLDKSGNPLAVNAMDFGYDRPYGTFEAGDGDGYDLLTIRNGLGERLGERATAAAIPRRSTARAARRTMAGSSSRPAFCRT